MDIPFGSDSATVKAAVLAKGGVKDDTSSHKDLLKFHNFSMSDRIVGDFTVLFVDNKAYDAFFYFPYNDADILSAYDNLVADLKAIYGNPDSYENGGEQANTAKVRKLRSGNLLIHTTWISKNKNAISVSVVVINQILNVSLRYEDGPLYNVNAAKRRSDL